MQDRRKIDTSANQDLIKTINQKLIIDLMRRNGSYSIKELAELSHLSIPAVSKNMEYLLEKGLVTKGGTVDTRMGRKPVEYQFNSAYRYIIGIDLGERIASITIGNLEGNFEKVYRMNLYQNRDPANFGERLTAEIDEILKKDNITEDKIGLIVVANPGVVEPETGRMQLPADNVYWHNVPLRNVLEKRYNIPALIFNDVNVSAMGELVYGAGKGLTDCVFIRLDVGLGSGIILNGKLYEGQNCAAGEIGFSIIDKANAGKAKETSRYIDSHLNMNAIVDRIRDMARRNHQSPILSDAGGNPDLIETTAIAMHINDDPIVQEVLGEMIKELGILISNITAVLNIPVVIIAGEATKLGSQFLGRLQQLVSELSPFPPKVILSENGENSGVYGAMAIGTEYFFNHLEYDI